MFSLNAGRGDHSKHALLIQLKTSCAQEAAHLALPLGGNLRPLLFQLQVKQPRAQQRKRLLLVFALAALLRAEDAYACGSSDTCCHWVRLDFNLNARHKINRLRLRQFDGLRL